MAQKDYTAPKKKIEQKTVINLNDFIKDFKKIILDRGFPVVVEQEHKESANDDGNRNLDLYWVTAKKPSTYVKLVLEVNFSASIKNVAIEKDGKKITVQDGTISIEIGGYLLKDVEDEWAHKKETPMRKVFRDIYDRFIGNEKLEKNMDELNSDIKVMINELKTYLKMHRMH